MRIVGLFIALALRVCPIRSRPRKPAANWRAGSCLPTGPPLPKWDNRDERWPVGPAGRHQQPAWRVPHLRPARRNVSSALPSWISALTVEQVSGAGWVRPRAFPR